MADSTENEFFTKKHRRLMNFASVANILAWIALVINILVMGVFTIQNITTVFSQPTIWEITNQRFLYTFGFIVEAVYVFLRGIVYWLVLKGISLGLNMIVETDLNYKDKFEGGSIE